MRLVRSTAQRMYPDGNRLRLKLVDVGICSRLTQITLIVVLEVDLRSRSKVLAADATDFQPIDRNGNFGFGYGRRQEYD